MWDPRSARVFKEVENGTRGAVAPPERGPKRFRVRRHLPKALQALGIEHLWTYLGLPKENPFVERGSRTREDMGINYNLDLPFTDLNPEAANSPSSSFAEAPHSPTTRGNPKPLSKLSPNPPRRAKSYGRIQFHGLRKRNNAPRARP